MQLLGQKHARRMERLHIEKPEQTNTLAFGFYWDGFYLGRFYWDGSQRFLVTKSDGDIRPVGTKSTIFKKLGLRGTSQAVVATVGAGARGTWRRIWFIFHLSASVNKRVATLLLFAVPRGLIGSSHWRKTLFFITPHQPSPPSPREGNG